MVWLYVDSFLFYKGICLHDNPMYQFEIHSLSSVIIVKLIKCHPFLFHSWLSLLCSMSIYMSVVVCPFTHHCTISLSGAATVFHDVPIYVSLYLSLWEFMVVFQSVPNHTILHLSLSDSMHVYCVLFLGLGCKVQIQSH